LKNLSSDASEAQPLIYKYKFFYFSKRVSPLDINVYEEWKTRETSQSSESALPNVEQPERTPDPSRPWFQQNPSREIPAIEPSEEKTASFEEIIQLITTGQPVPGIRQIPDQLSTEPPSTSSSPAPPKKPWEK